MPLVVDADLNGRHNLPRRGRCAANPSFEGVESEPVYVVLFGHLLSVELLVGCPAELTSAFACEPDHVIEQAITRENVQGLLNSLKFPIPEGRIETGKRVPILLEPLRVLVEGVNVIAATSIPANIHAFGLR